MDVGQQGSRLPDDGVAADDAQEPNVVISVRDVRKTYGTGLQQVEVLKGLDLDVSKGQMLAVIGPSGSGKSTLLHVLSGLDSYDSGEIVVAGRNLADLGERERAEWRAKHIGFVLQQNNFIPSLTIEENVAAPRILTGEKRSSALARAREMLAEVGVAERARAWPGEASVGQLQRAALARAVVNRPLLIFADEPTGALDSENRDVVVRLLRSVTREVGAAAIVVTHDPAVAAAGDRVVRMLDGRIEEATAPTAAGAASEEKV